MLIFSGSSYPEFSKRVCEHINIPLSKAKLSTFADGERSVIIEDNVRNQECVIIQPTARSDIYSVNDHIIELLILVDALKRGSASRIVVVLPYFGYERSDRKDYSRAPISANVIATCLEAVNVDRVIVYDLHAGQIAGFFSNKCPVDNLYNEIYFIKYIKEYILDNRLDETSLNEIVIVAPDEGAVKTAIRVSSKLKCGAATIFKKRDNPNEVGLMKLMGDVNGKIAIIIDDMIDTAGTACKAANVLSENGAKEVYMLASHGLFSPPSIDRINNSKFKKIIVTNTVSPTKETVECDKINIIDVSWLCAEAKERQHTGNSLKELYDNENILYNKNIEIKFIQ